MQKFILSFTAVVTVGMCVTSPAFAVTGRQAVGACIDKPGCEWWVGPKGEIAVVTNGTVITCPGADAKCTVPHFEVGPPPGFKRETGPLSIGHS
jgi:hypothetical protein